MKLPYIPITSPEKQMDSVTQFCHAWDGPIIVEYDNEQVFIMPYSYYKAKFCTLEEAVEIEEQPNNCRDDTNQWEFTV